MRQDLISVTFQKRVENLVSETRLRKISFFSTHLRLMTTTATAQTHHKGMEKKEEGKEGLHATRPPHLMLRLAVPMSHELTLVANRSEEMVSVRSRGSGETLTNMRVFELPPK